MKPKEKTLDDRDIERSFNRSMQRILRETAQMMSLSFLRSSFSCSRLQLHVGVGAGKPAVALRL